MYKVDYHIHTNFSLDCNTPIEEIVKKALKMNIKEIAITDHIDFDFPDSHDDIIDIDEYYSKMSAISNKYKNDITILCGLELGLQTHILNKVNNLINKHPLDFIIGSIHTCDKKDLYSGEFFKDKNQKYAYLRYFENVLENIRLYDEFDVVGHLDYIIRYGNFENKKLSYLDYSDIIDDILTTIIMNGKGIELNTSGYRYGLNQTHPQLDILTRYKELGGEIVTVGSDSHTAETLCSDFDIAYELLKEVGINTITLFRNRKPIFKKI